MGFILPKAVFDQHTITLGKTRSGKSSVLRLMVEYALDQEWPTCIIDPKGDWWGLKASADGKHAGYPVVIFGGEHADVPLNPRSGAAVAELVATGNRPSIIDLGGWMPGERTQFYIDFASTFFIKTRGRRILAIDEVHNFCPKGKIMDPRAGVMLHWSNRFASEGAGKGISLLAASQRPQKVHNDFLTSCETLIAMRVIHAAYREALSEWIDGCGDPEKGEELLNTIALMKRGEGWVWSPEAEFGPKRIQFPMFKTYDSFKARTSEGTLKLKGWADVDLDEVKKKLDTVVKEAEAKDPAKLQARIRELESQVRAKGATRPTAPAPAEYKSTVVGLTKRIEQLRAALGEAMKIIVRVSAFSAEGKELKPEQLEKAFEATKREIQRIAKDKLDSRSRELDLLKNEAKRVLARIEQLTSKESIKVHVTVGEAEHHPVPPSRGTGIARALMTGLDETIHRSAPPKDLNGMKRPVLRILQALAEFEAIGRSQGVTRSSVASWLGVKAGTGSFKNYLSELRVAGLITDVSSDIIKLTDAGRDATPPVERPASTEALLERAQGVFGSTPAKMLKLIHENYPNEVTRDYLAEKLGISSETGSFKNYLSELRSAGLIEDRAEKRVVCAEWMFIDS